MRIVELRRHTERDASDDLTEAGRLTAARAKASLEGPYAAAYVSPAKRARLTAEALGLGRVTPEPRLAPRPREPFAPYERRHEELMGFSTDAVTAWFAIPECVPLLIDYGEVVLRAVLDIAAKLAAGARAIGISHGGTIEPFAVAATGRPYAELFGTAELGYCEGVRAHLAKGAVARLDVIRLPV